MDERVMMLTDLRGGHDFDAVLASALLRRPQRVLEHAHLLAGHQLQLRRQSALLRAIGNAASKENEPQTRHTHVRASEPNSASPSSNMQQTKDADGRARKEKGRHAKRERTSWTPSTEESATVATY